MNPTSVHQQPTTPRIKPAWPFWKAFAVTAIHYFAMLLYNISFEMQVWVAKVMGVDHPRQAIRQVLVALQMARFRQEVAALGLAQEDDDDDIEAFAETLGQVDMDISRPDDNRLH